MGGLCGGGAKGIVQTIEAGSVAETDAVDEEGRSPMDSALLRAFDIAQDPIPVRSGGELHMKPGHIQSDLDGIALQ
jgi:hypothetical protein